MPKGYYPRTDYHRKRISQGAIKYNFKGNRNPNWKGGAHSHCSYRLIYIPNHPFADCQGYVREHRLIMERQLNRFLNPREVVHHINKNRKDNRIENLILFSNEAEHQRHHSFFRKRNINNKQFLKINLAQP